jgi:hypothetical protein
MMSKELFIEAMRTAGDFAGVFEYDGEVGYFYLYRLSESGSGGKIDGAIEIVQGDLTFAADEIEVRWSAEQDRVALFVDGKLWALFNVKSGTAYGQKHSKLLASNVPPDQIFS